MTESAELQVLGPFADELRLKIYDEVNALGMNAEGLAVDVTGEPVHQTGPRKWQAKIGRIPVSQE